MYSEEYLRDLETFAHLYKQEQEKLMNVIEICPVCGRKYEKQWWRSPCCGVEMIWIENGKETTMEDVKINMTNQEAIKALQEFALNYGLNNKMIDAFGKAIRALEKEPILDKIRAEIIELPTISFNANDVYKADILQIIDKYKAESEENDE